jgi:TonB family protein
VVAVLVAVFGHALVITLLALFGGFAPLESLASLPATPPSSAAATPQVATAEDDRPMEIETIVNQLDRPESKTPEEEKREEEAKKEEEDKKPNGQVVDIARPTVEQRPDKADYAAEYDSKVDRETKGPQGRDKAGGQAESAPPVGRPDVASPIPAVKGGAPEDQLPGKQGKPGAVAMRESEPRHQTEQGREGPEPAPDGEDARAGQKSPPPDPAQRRAERAGEEGQNGKTGRETGHEAAVPGLPGDRKPNLAATPEMLQRAIGKGSGSMDYLKDLDDGESTALNAKKWKHAPFFNRVKRAVANEWHPEVTYVRHDPSGNVYGVKDRVTTLRVRLSPDGKLVAWTILQSSGVDFLDDEAIDAFRKAAPFANPPKDLVEADGTIQFNFGFIFELSGRSSLKVYKYN